ncbi:MAG: alanine--tRNA ligase [Chlamydiales bacterium]|nr:alanine--tRNA ligase [Chlamydiales bacterium]
MISQEIRRRFLQYFKDKGHTVIPSSPVVPHDDPTLLFINAGMNQFKDVFLGKSMRDYSMAASSQKCIRVGGKHNDLENVGHTNRHLTFFEMLGNFSFGDYFKKEAIAFAWEVTLHVFGYDPKYLWATVFHEDEESFELWKPYIPEERIVRMGAKDNFWAMGDTGPCGPCSELYYDKGPAFGPARSPAEDIEGERFLEFWNLVFMEFNRDPSGEMHPLPKKSVDTGAGLERVASIKMGTESLFETDILRSLIAQVEKISRKAYDPHSDTAPAFRVIADHMRSLSFAIADGVQPSNIERGYVLRKVLRRAVRYGRQLGLDQPFLGKILPRLIEMMGEDFPELVTSSARIEEIITLEEEGFLRTLKRGGQLLNQIITDSTASGHISGEDAFKLKDTYGLPLEEILLLAKDAHLPVDINRFEELEREAKERSRGARKTTAQMAEESAYEGYISKHGACEFFGYKQLTSEAIVLGLMKEGEEVVALHPGEEGIVLLDRTPFYAEKGGQVGDQGLIVGDESRFMVTDCQTPYTDVISHHGVLKAGSLRVGDSVTASVDVERRGKIANNHTATHLLHWALQQVLGPHIRQAGSVVEPRRLRFDFSHHKALSKEEIHLIEDLVNEKIRENRPVHAYELSFSEVQKKEDIKQFFGEKYGNVVRVIDIDFSKELCGGTHTSQVGNIGYFRISKESSIAAGVRRIEAVTGEEAESLSRESEERLDEIAATLNVQPGQLAARLDQLVDENRNLAQELSHLRRELLTVEVENLMEQIERIGSVSYLGHAATLEPRELRECADIVMQKEQALLLFLIGKQEGKCSLLIRVSEDLIGKGVRANELIKEIAPLLGGKGGGKADSAQGGGTEMEKIPEAFEAARRWFEQKLSKRHV